MKKQKLRHLAARGLGLALILSCTVMLTVPGAAAQMAAREVIPLGNPAGIRLAGDGVVVVGVDRKLDVDLQSGDRILTVNGESVDSGTQVQAIVNRCDGQPITITVQRGEKTVTATLTPWEQDGAWHIGLWLRDAMLGVGTLTYYDPATDTLAALGHGVSENGALLPMKGAKLVQADVESVQRSEKGKPGALQGRYDVTHLLGIVQKNTPAGLYARAETEFSGESIPVATAAQVRPGEAQVLTTVQGDTPQLYDIRILRVSPGGEGQLRQLRIQVTDPRLLAVSGGIVQGMSGSPILQNGRLVGAVTHVLTENPALGYGILAESMLKETDAAASVSYGSINSKFYANSGSYRAFSPKMPPEVA